MTKAQSPSTKLASALQQYGEELEALHDSLRQIMALFSFLRTHQQVKIREFAKDFGSEITEDEERLSFLVPAGRTSEFKRLASGLRNTRSSQRLIPRNFLVALVCTYDAFLGRVIRFVLEAKPEILDSSDRSLSYSQLLSFSDVAAAREYLVEKEIESVLRKSHIEHFKWLEAKLGTPFNKGLQSWPQFVELTERRNLFVHTDGVISSQYLSVCKEQKCDLPDSSKVGHRLEVTDTYFTSAYRCLYEIGVKLAHVVWRKMLRSEIEDIDSNLNDISYNLIEKGDYEVAIRVLEFFTHDSMPHGNDASKRVMLINLAQAYKWNEQNDSCTSTIQRVDWSASQDKFLLAVSVLNDDWESAFKFMRRLVHDSEFQEGAYRDWPLFKELRKQERFPLVFEECYKKPFAQKEEVKTPAEQDPNDPASRAE